MVRRKTQKFFISNGVRRALASREAGRKTISAIIYREGRPPERRPRMRLDQLYSSKLVVEVDDRYTTIVPPIAVPIEVEALGTRGQQKSIPLTDVVLE